MSTLPCPDPHVSTSSPSLCAAVIQKVLMKDKGELGMEGPELVYWLVMEIPVPPEQTQLNFSL